MIAKDTGHKDTFESETDNRLLPDIVIYPTHDTAKDAYLLQETDASVPIENDCNKGKGKRTANQAIEDERQPYKAKTSWNHMLLMFEVKADRYRTGFGMDAKEKFLPTGKERQRARGQHADYITQMLTHQHLLYAFQVVTCKRRARLLRWDRAGIVVSESFDIINKNSPLHRFLFRFSKMVDFQRGADPTATLASDAEAKLMRDQIDKLPERSYVRERLRLATTPGHPIYKLEFLPEHYPKGTRGNPHKQSRYFLVGNPDFASPSPTGRATKNYVAYDMFDDRIVYLKDTWRPPTTPGVHPEREVYESLKKHEVPFVAHLVCGGDVQGENVQKTTTQNYGRLDHRIHYRIVVEEVCRPLKAYWDSHALVYTVLCALLGVSYSHLKY